MMTKDNRVEEIVDIISKVIIKYISDNKYSEGKSKLDNE